LGAVVICRLDTSSSVFNDRVFSLEMRRPFALFSGPEPSRHMQSSADFITITFGFRFSVHTGLYVRLWQLEQFA